jgi:hypothetical protein
VNVVIQKSDLIKPKREECRKWLKKISLGVLSYRLLGQRSVKRERKNQTERANLTWERAVVQGADAACDGDSMGERSHTQTHNVSKVNVFLNI